DRVNRRTAPVHRHPRFLPLLSGHRSRFHASTRVSYPFDCSEAELIGCNEDRLPVDEATGVPEVVSSGGLDIEKPICRSFSSRIVNETRRIVPYGGKATPVSSSASS